MRKPRYYISTDGMYAIVFMYEENNVTTLVDCFKIEEANDCGTEYGVRRMYQKTLPLITVKHE